MRGRLLLTLTLGAAACGSRTGLDGARDAAALPEARPSSCGPDSCAGCCDDAGACQAGDAQSSCGEQGRACVACELSLNEICNPQPGQPDERVCWAPCDPRYCGGGCCLASGTCLQDAGDTACGSIGHLCTDCTQTGQVCGTVSGVRACVSL